MEAELERLLAECADVRKQPEDDQQKAAALAEIDRKIKRLISAPAESNDLSMGYINRTIAKLESQRQVLLAQQARQCGSPPAKLKHLKFDHWSLSKKICSYTRYTGLGLVQIEGIQSSFCI